MNQEVRNLLKAISPIEDEPTSVKATRGRVTQDNLNGTVDLVLGAGTAEIEAAYLDHYSPTVDDEVLVLVVGADRIVIGKYA